MKKHKIFPKTMRTIDAAIKAIKAREKQEKQWKIRRDEVLAEEANEPLHWWYCSFADEVFHGACIIEARGVVGCAIRAHELAISPGGQLVAIPIHREDLPPDQWRNRLLTAEQVKALWPDAKSLGELEKDEA